MLFKITRGGLFDSESEPTPKKKPAKVDNRQLRREQMLARHIATRDKAIERQRAKEAGGLVNPNTAIGKAKRKV